MSYDGHDAFAGSSLELFAKKITSAGDFVEDGKRYISTQQPGRGSSLLFDEG